ncbi:GNAT family N-acetyltransferase [Actinomadura logoneensis]|uniref:GNAT family N-acetyltransferase n=1 Tax=Actinomadura logoneensis TaxID=2293572 RepID=A0A372JC86_9ACTN|nr:GNAT family N-acetyltransferase [Actinomadura logoneensis]RFU37570.1 GNAT family N-acetyltransferase [Actinomadura logoneensis]
MIKGFSVRLLDPRRDTLPPGWDEFRASEGLHAVWSPQVLGALTALRTPPLLAVCSDADRIAGVVGGVYLGLRRGTPRPWREPLIFDMRLPGQSGPPWHFAERVPPAARRALLRRVERLAARRLGPGCLGVVYRPLSGGDLALVARRGTFTLESAEGTRMPVEFGSVDEWLRSLSKSRRTDLRRQVRMIDAAGDLEVAVGVRRTDLDADELARMHAAHTAKLAARFDVRAPLPPEYFRALCERDDVAMVSYRETPSGRLLAWGTLLMAGAAPGLGAWAALDPADGGRKHLYFDHYVRLLGLAVESARDAKEPPVLNGGQGMAEVKRSLGFETVPMRTLVVPRPLVGR